MPCLQPAALHVLDVFGVHWTDLESSVRSQTVELWTQRAGVSYLKTILDPFVRRGTVWELEKVNGGLERALTGASVHVGGPSWHGCDGAVTSWQLHTRRSRVEQGLVTVGLKASVCRDSELRLWSITLLWLHSSRQVIHSHPLFRRPTENTARAASAPSNEAF